MTLLTSPTDQDLIKVASCGSPIEAQLLRGMLEAHGLRAELADYHTVQTQPLWGAALGGIRVMVPRAQQAQAQSLILAFEAQQMALPDGLENGEDGIVAAAPERPAPVEFRPLPRPVFPPDATSLLGVFLSPVFSALLLVINEWRVGTRRQLGLQLAGLLAVAAVTGWMLLTLPHRLHGGASVAVSLTFLLLPVLAGWYFVFGREQAARIIQQHGPRHARLSLATPALIGAVIWGSLLLAVLMHSD